MEENEESEQNNIPNTSSRTYGTRIIRKYNTPTIEEPLIDIENLIETSHIPNIHRQNQIHITEDKTKELVDYFQGTISAAKQIQDNGFTVTLHCDQLPRTTIAMIAKKLNLTPENDMSRHGNYIHLRGTLQPDDISQKICLDSKTKKDINPNIKEICNNMEYNPKFDASTQVNQRKISNTLEQKIQEKKKAQLNILIPDTQHIQSIPQLPKNVVFNEKTFLNYSNIKITTNIAYILGMGPKFCSPLANKTRKELEYIEKTAILINQAYGKPNNEEQVEEHVRDIIANFLKNPNKWSDDIIEYHTQATQETLNFLQNNNTAVIVCQADKAKKTLLLNYQDYTHRVYQLLADNTTYVIMDKSAIAAYITMNKKFLNELQKRGYINIHTLQHAIETETKIANMYAFIKTHKDGLPVRPIINCTNTPGYQLAKTITEVLRKALPPNPYAVKNSTELRVKLQKLCITPSMNFVSYDVVSMFTNITWNRVQQAITKRYQCGTINTRIPMDLLLKMIKYTAFMNTEFMFEGTVFKQIKGLRMGSPISPILADLVMQDIFDTVFTLTRKPKLFVQYVDDILTLTTEQHAIEILEALNDTDPDVQFEIEIETNNKINFLDITIYNNHNTTITTSWYKKGYASLRILNYHSTHEQTTIINTAKNYVINMLNSSSPEYQQHTLTTAHELLRNNSFPQEVALNIMRSACQSAKPFRMTNEPERSNLNTSGSPDSASTSNTSGGTPNSQNTQNTQPSGNSITATSTPKEKTRYSKYSLPLVPGVTNLVKNALKQNSKDNITIATASTNSLNTQIFNKAKDINKGPPEYGKKRKRQDDEDIE